MEIKWRKDSLTVKEFHNLESVQKAVYLQELLLIPESERGHCDKIIIDFYKNPEVITIKNKKTFELIKDTSTNT